MLGKRLKRLRMELGVSQQKISTSLGYSKNTWNNYEWDKRKPDSEFFVKLIKQYNANPIWLLIGRGHMFFDPERDPNRVDHHLLDSASKGLWQSGVGTAPSNAITADPSIRHDGVYTDPRDTSAHLPLNHSGVYSEVTDIDPYSGHYSVQEVYPPSCKQLGETIGVEHQSGVHVLPNNYVKHYTNPVFTRARSDWMAPYIIDNDLILVDRNEEKRELLDPGEIYLITLDSPHIEFSVFPSRVSRQGDKLLLIPSDIQREAIAINIENGDVKKLIFGRVVMVMRDLERIL